MVCVLRVASIVLWEPRKNGAWVGDIYCPFRGNGFEL